jgi:hypothetical protein
VFHPVLAAVEPAVLIGGGVEGGVLVHARVDQVLRGGVGTSVNLPLMPLSLGAGTEWGGAYAWIRPVRCAARSSCRRPSPAWPRTLSLPLFYCSTFHHLYFITQGGPIHLHLNILYHPTLGNPFFPFCILVVVRVSTVLVRYMYTSRQLIDITPMKQSL